jgi:four helix bundle protein
MAYEHVNIQDELVHFGVEVIVLADKLSELPSYDVLASQLIRSGTAAGANYEEACRAENITEYTHYLHLSFKELHMTRYWLQLILKSGMVRPKMVDPVLEKSERLENILRPLVRAASPNHQIENRPI